MKWFEFFLVILISFILSFVDLRFFFWGLIDYQINKEETTGWEICGQLSCDNCQLTKCPQGSIAF